MSKQIVARANLLVLGVLIGFLALMGALTWDGFSAARDARQWTGHTYQVLAGLRELGLTLRDAETGQRGYLLTGDDAYLAPYDAALGRIAVLQGDLQRLTADNPVQQDRLRALAPVLQHRLQQLAQAMQLRRDFGLQAATGLLRTDAGRATMQEIETTLDAMIAEEQSLLTRRQDAAESRSDRVRQLAFAGAGFAILALVWAARLLNQAWARANAMQADQRTLAGRLRASLDSLSQGVAVFGPAFRLRHWNDCFQVLLGLPPGLVREDTPYAAFVDFTGGERDGFLETEDQVRHGQHTSNEPIVYERIQADGRLLEIRRTPAPDDGFVLTVSDMTKRAQAEAVLRESQKMQAIGQLTGGIAHDFNNLLTVIMGNLELARARLPSQDPVVAQIDRALWAAQRGGTLTSQLLAFARKQPLAPAPIDLSSTLPELVPLLRRTLGETIEVRFVDAAGLWPAMADSAQLESAVLNLALNARDAMPGGGRLTIELANKVLDEEYARRHAEVTQAIT